MWLLYLKNPYGVEYLVVLYRVAWNWLNWEVSRSACPLIQALKVVLEAVSNCYAECFNHISLMIIKIRYLSFVSYYLLTCIIVELIFFAIIICYIFLSDLMKQWLVQNRLIKPCSICIHITLSIDHQLSAYKDLDKTILWSVTSPLFVLIKYFLGM